MIIPQTRYWCKLRRGKRTNKAVWRAASVVSIVLALVLTILPAGRVFADANGYTKLPLISDTPGLATTTDPNLINPWGLSHSPTGPWWISDNNAGHASLYSGRGVQVAPAITISSSSGGTGTPTGDIFNPISTILPEAFTIHEGSNSGASAFLFATEDGTILGWNRNVDSSKAIIAVDRANVSDAQGDMGAVYKGLAFGFNDFQPYIYATNFRLGTIEMFNKSFHLVKSFTDPQLANTCPFAGQCYAPFGIQNIKGRLYVTFALQQVGKHDDQAGAGNGFVDVFNTNGTLQKRLIAHGDLNSPWGLALAPRDFGPFSRDLLVGNFGDGTIHAYNPATGALKGTLSDINGKPIQTDGLWGLSFGNGFAAGERNELFFSAGINDEAHGLFGKIVENE